MPSHPPPRPLARLLCLGLFALLLTGGCARTALQLSYPAPEAVTPQVGVPSVCVVRFDDARGRTTLGSYRDGTPIQAARPVNGWLARALADEMAAQGFAVSYAPSLDPALSSGAAYIVTGSIDDIWLLEASMTHYSCTIRLTLSVLRGDGTHISRNNFSATVTRGTFPLLSGDEKALTEAAVELIRPAAQSISAKLH